MKPASSLRHEARADAELLLSIASGDLSDLGRLFDRHQEDVRRLLVRLGTPAFDIDDLVQETFLDVPRASRRFRPDASVRPWLLGLATIVVRRRRRSLVRMLAHLRRWAREPAARQAPTPADDFEAKAEAMRAQVALKALSRKKREAFVLVALEGLTCAEAAEILGAPVATIWTRIHYARAELRELLEEEEA